MTVPRSTAPLNPLDLVAHGPVIPVIVLQREQDALPLAEARRQADEWLRRVGLGGFGDRWFGTSEVFPFHRQARDVVALDATFLHWGEPDIATKVDKVNRYSSGMVAHRLGRGRYRWPALRMVVQPPWHFVRSYVLKRKFLAGTAGFIGCVVDAFYVFLKYAKLVEAEARRKARPDQS